MERQISLIVLWQQQQHKLTVTLLKAEEKTGKASWEDQTSRKRVINEIYWQ